MSYALPAGVVNTDSAYFYATTAIVPLGPHVKQTSDQTLMVIDYSQITPDFALSTFAFTVDVSSNPELVISYAMLDATGQMLSFLVSGGIAGQQYGITINANNSERIDTLTINIPSSGDCCDVINPVPAIYNQLPLGGGGYINSAARFFWGVAPPTNPNVMDHWYNTAIRGLFEWVTDGTSFKWQAISAGAVVIGSTPPDNPLPGQFWFDDMGGQTYIWYVDADTGQWVPAVNQAGAYLPLNNGGILPTSTEGLAPGTVWNNGGFVCIV